MKIDSTDIREFDAKQLSVEFTPPQTTVTVDMFECFDSVRIRDIYTTVRNHG